MTISSHIYKTPPKHTSNTNIHKTFFSDFHSNRVVRNALKHAFKKHKLIKKHKILFNNSYKVFDLIIHWTRITYSLKEFSKDY